MKRLLLEGCPIQASDTEGPATFRDVWERINGRLDEDARLFVHCFEVLR